MADHSIEITVTILGNRPHATQQLMCSFIDGLSIAAGQRNLNARAVRIQVARAAFREAPTLDQPTRCCAMSRRTVPVGQEQLYLDAQPTLRTSTLRALSFPSFHQAKRQRSPHCGLGLRRSVGVSHRFPHSAGACQHDYSNVYQEPGKALSIDEMNPDQQTSCPGFSNPTRGREAGEPGRCSGGIRHG